MHFLWGMLFGIFIFILRLWGLAYGSQVTALSNRINPYARS